LMYLVAVQVSRQAPNLRTKSLKLMSLFFFRLSQSNHSNQIIRFPWNSRQCAECS
jgi:hypothetical protein